MRNRNQKFTARESADEMDPSEETTAPAREGDDGGGIAVLSRPSRIVITTAAAAVALGVAFHLAMVFLHVAPQNTLSAQQSELVSGYVYPEFEQNWKLFAPDPLQANIHVWARAEIRTADGTRRTLGWVDLTAMDIAKIRGNPFPSHTQQNELRRAWNFYSDTHDNGKPIGDRGLLSGQYLQRIVQTRFGPRLNGGEVVRVQVRVGTTMLPAPPWTDEKVDTTTSFEVLPWWTVTPEDTRRGQGDEA